MKKRSIAAMVVLVVMAACLGSVSAKAEGTEVGLDVTWAERYLWRSMPVNDEYVLQPSLTVGGGGFYLNGWANVDLTDWGLDKKAGYGDERNNPTEIDFAAGYEGSILDDKVSLGFGFVNYTFPNLEDIGWVATTEIYGSVGLDVPLAPALTAYVDEDQAEGAAYIALDLGHSFPIVEDRISLDLSGHLGWANHKFIKTYYGGMNKDSRLHDWVLTGSAPITLMEGITLTPAYQYSSIMSDDLRDFWDEADREKEIGIFTLTLSIAGEV